MKKMKSLWMLMAIVAASFTFTSCDDADPWYDDPWDDPYGWYDDYNHGDWGWKDNSWNQGSHGSQNDQLVSEAQTLVGLWSGPVKYSYIQDDGNSRATDEFYAEMQFYQFGYKQDALSGNGVETDYVYDDDGKVTDQQILKFTWYIDNNGDIYMKYTDSGATFVMDAGASQYGFHLGQEDGKNYDTFYGYMIGTGKVKGDVIYFDLSASSITQNAKSVSRSIDSHSKASFGSGALQKPIVGTVKQLNTRR